MLYVTCTISYDENEGVVKSFLRTNRDMSLINIKDHIPPQGRELVDDHGFLKTYLRIGHIDGFFAALFAKN